MRMRSTDVWRGVVLAYVRGFPVTRGKRWLMEALASRYATTEERTCQLPGGARIRVNLNEHVQRWIDFFGAYEAETVRWFRHTLRPDMTVLDIGAHVGQYSLIAASEVGPRGRVHSFEPNPSSFRRLTTNIELNGFSNVRPHPIALSDSIGEATLYVPKHDNLGEASLQPCQTGMEETRVRCTTLDEWSRSADIGNPARIDLDEDRCPRPRIEGHLGSA